MAWWDVQRDGPCWPIPEEAVQAQIVQAFTAEGWVVLQLSQVRETQQTEGIPDLYLWHEEYRVAFWCEVKRPAVWQPGRRPGTRRLLQRQGKRSWEQERLHESLLRAGVPCVTVDSVAGAWAYAAYLGAPIPRERYGAPYDPADQARFTDPQARPSHHQVRRLKSGKRVHLPRSYWARRLGVP